MAKRKTAGTAYLEAIAVSFIMVLLFACAARFFGAAQARLIDARRLRASAWSKALAGCEPGKSLGVACNDPPHPDSGTGERDVATFMAGVLAEGEAR